MLSLHLFSTPLKMMKCMNAVKSVVAVQLCMLSLHYSQLWFFSHLIAFQCDSGDAPPSVSCLQAPGE